MSSTGTKDLLQGDDNGHVGRPCEVSLAPGRPPFWRTLEESCKGLGSVTLKITNQHTLHRRRLLLHLTFVKAVHPWACRYEATPSASDTSTLPRRKGVQLCKCRVEVGLSLGCNARCVCQQPPDKEEEACIQVKRRTLPAQTCVLAVT